MKFYKSITYSLPLWLSLLFLTFPVMAQWAPLGPFGGDVRALVQCPADPQRFYLGTVDSQIYLSTDGGTHWQRLSAIAPRSDLVVDHIAIDPTHPQRIFAAAWSVLNNSEGGVFRSEDGGLTWKDLPAMRTQSVRAFEIAPSNPSILVAGTLDGVFQSGDSGETWKEISPPSYSEIRNVQSVAIDPLDPQIIYVGTWHLPWKTRDGGAHWHSIHQGMIEDSDVFAIFVQPSAPNNALLTACTGIYGTSDGGEVWTKLKGIPSSSRRTRAINEDPSDPRIIYAGTTEGLWKSVDSGANWRLMTSRTLTVNAISIDRRNPSRILLGTDDSGILVSGDGGEHFVGSNTGFTSRVISSVLFDRVVRHRIFVSVLYDHEDGGVFQSDDGGKTWRQRIDGLLSTDVHTLFQSPEDDSIWAGTSDGIYIFDSSAARWKRVDVHVELAAHGTTVRGRSQLASKSHITEKDPPSVLIKGLGAVMSFSGDPSHGHRFYAASQKGLFVTRDAGAEWVKVSVPTAPDKGTAVLSFPDGRLFYGTSVGLYSSMDDGGHWSYVPSDDGPVVIHFIAAAPGNDTVLLIGTERGLYRSSDGGRSWARNTGGLPRAAISSIHFALRSGVHIYASEPYYGGLYESNDLGVTWNWINPLPSSGLKYSAFLADPHDDSRSYMLFFREGLYGMASISTGATEGK